MNTMINRESEIRVLEGAITALLDPNVLLRMPIVEFYGIDGIGKTTLLSNAFEMCKNNNISCVWVEPDLNTPGLNVKIGQESSLFSNIEFQEFIEKRSKRERFVTFVDLLDNSNERQYQQIENFLTELTDSGNTFVGLASKRLISFDDSRPISRKLTTIHLNPFTRENSYRFIQSSNSNIPLGVQEFIYDWTRGYPLAMKVLTESLNENKYDYLKQQDQRSLVATLDEKVINLGILCNIKDEEVEWYKHILTTLSFPRRFNLIVMQELIEKYSSNYKLESRLSYISMPQKINQATGAMNWSMSRGGFTVEESARNIFSLIFKITEPDKYFDIHTHLASYNKKCADTSSGFDRIRYAREFIYHSSQIMDSDKYLITFEEYIEKVIKEETYEVQLQFYEEVIQDQELQQSTEQLDIIVLPLRKHLKIEV